MCLPADKCEHVAAKNLNEIKAKAEALGYHSEREDVLEVFQLISDLMKHHEAGLRSREAQNKVDTILSIIENITEDGTTENDTVDGLRQRVACLSGEKMLPGNNTLLVLAVVICVVLSLYIVQGLGTHWASI